MECCCSKRGTEGIDQYQRGQEYVRDNLHRSLKKGRRCLLVEPMAKGESPGLLLKFAVDRDHLGVLDVKDTRAEGIVESCQPVRKGSLHIQVLGGLCRNSILQCLLIIKKVRGTREVVRFSIVNEVEHRVCLIPLFLHTTKGKGSIPCGKWYLRR